MDSIHSIVKKAQDDLFPELEAKIRFAHHKICHILECKIH